MEVSYNGGLALYRWMIYFRENPKITWMIWGYPLVNKQKAIEHGPFIVDLRIEDCDFP